MKNQILKLGKSLTKEEQKSVNGGGVRPESCIFQCGINGGFYLGNGECLCYIDKTLQ